MFFSLSSPLLALLLFAVLFGATALGLWIGRSQRHRSENLREPFAALQAALLGMVGLLLAFGLAMAVDRYESRRAAVVADANAIGTTYLRAQTASRAASRRATPPSAPKRTACDWSASSGRTPAGRSPLRPPTPRRASTSRPSTR